MTGAPLQTGEQFSASNLTQKIRTKPNVLLSEQLQTHPDDSSLFLTTISGMKDMRGRRWDDGHGT